MSKKFLIDDIRNKRFASANSPSCETCGYYFSSVRAVVKSSEYQETLCLCEDCWLTIEHPRDSFGESYFEIVTIEERY